MKDRISDEEILSIDQIWHEIICAMQKTMMSFVEKRGLLRRVIRKKDR